MSLMAERAQSGRGVYVGQVLDNRRLCRDHLALSVELEGFPQARAGQFVQLQCRSLDGQTSGRAVDWPDQTLPLLSQPELADREPLLRRPLSIAGCRIEGGLATLELIYRTLGTGTHWLGGVKAGQRFSVLGPLGNGFPIRQAGGAALVGGGVGIPPMIFLARQLAAAGKGVVAFCGARTDELMPLTLDPAVPASPAGHPSLCAAEFAACGVQAVLASDDGSVGFGGMVSEALRTWLNAHDPAPGDLTVYCCGPEPLMQATADIALSRGYECHLALERHMACGMGTCQSCVVKLARRIQPGRLELSALLHRRASLQRRRRDVVAPPRGW